MGKASYIWYILVVIGVILIGCKNGTSKPCISKVVDLAGDDTISFKLKYDEEHRIVAFGKTTISYQGDIIEVGKMTDVPKYEDLFGVTFQMQSGRVTKSEAHCMEKISGRVVEVKKITTYIYKNKQIIAESKSYDKKTRELLKVFKEVRKLGDDGRILKVLSEDTDRGNSTTTYNYGANITYSANLNLQAYAYVTNGLDDMFTYLLDLYNTPQNMLPDEVVCIFPNGSKHTYVENFRIDGDLLTRIEVIMDYETLILRTDFEYKSGI